MVNSRYLCLAVILLVMPDSLIFSQEDRPNTEFIVKGQLINSSNLEPVPFAHVINKNNYYGAISDTMGYFTIRMFRRDTLLISVIGYDRRQYVIPDFITTGPYYPRIYLKEISYTIGEVEILSLGSYSQFREKVAKLNMPETKEEKLEREIREEARETAVENYQIPTGITFRIPTKADVSWQKVLELQEIEKRQMVLYRKFNREVIARTTKLEGEILDEFIMFCNQRSWFTPETSSYDIIYQIKAWYRQFLVLKGMATPQRQKR